MTDLYDRIVNQHSSFQEMLARVPGYKGYQEMTDRRSADRMIRDHVVSLLKEQMARLMDIDRKILSAGGLAEAGKTQEARIKFQTFIDQVSTANPGYAGFFDAQKIGPQ